jgi:hypothetical protein
LLVRSLILAILPWLSRINTGADVTMRTNLSLKSEHNTMVRGVLAYVACYLAWLLFAVVGFWLLLSLRTNLVDAAILMQFNPWQVRTLDRFAIFTLGLAWFVGILVLENYLRSGVARGLLWGRMIRVTLALGLVCAISYGLQVVVTL